MNDLISDDPAGEQTVAKQHETWDGAAGLTREEIEAGLQRLQDKLAGRRLPFIVLIEDDDIDAQLFKSAVQAVGVTVELMHFSDGLQAMRFFRGEKSFSDRDRFPLPDLVVLDVKLERGGGLAILKLIKSELNLKDLPVVALTASHDKEEMEEARFLNINNWLAKPQNHDELISLVHTIIHTWLLPSGGAGKLQ